MPTEAAMKLLGEVQGVKWYWADEHFTEPGVYYWNGAANVRVIPSVSAADDPSAKWPFSQSVDAAPLALLREAREAGFAEGIERAAGWLEIEASGLEAAISHGNFNEQTILEVQRLVGQKQESAAYIREGFKRATLAASGPKRTFVRNDSVYADARKGERDRREEDRPEMLDAISWERHCNKEERRSRNQLSDRRQSAPRPERSLDDACKPWEFCVGEPPEWESPLMNVWQAAITWAQQHFADMLGVKDYNSDGATETVEGDMLAGFRSILHKADLSDYIAPRPDRAGLRVRASREHRIGIIRKMELGQALTTDDLTTIRLTILASLRTNDTQPGEVVVPRKLTEPMRAAMQRMIVEEGYVPNSDGYEAMWDAAIKAAPSGRAG